MSGACSLERRGEGTHFREGSSKSVAQKTFQVMMLCLPDSELLVQQCCLQSLRNIVLTAVLLSLSQGKTVTNRIVRHYLYTVNTGL